MKRSCSLALFAGLTLLCLSFMKRENAPAGRAVLLEADTVFLAEAASSGIMQIQMGSLAQRQASGEDIKRLGRMMMRDQEAAAKELRTAASQLGLKTPDTMMPKHSRQVYLLEGLQGTAFDRTYLTMMMAAHKQDIDQFEEASKKAKDEGVKQFATRQLPLLKLHRDTVMSLRKRARG